jgi:hypothetical protein
MTMPRALTVPCTLPLLVLLFSFPAPAASPVFPAIIPLPAGFAAEGIASGRGTSFFVASPVDGAIYQGDLRTGAGDILVPGPGGPALGLSFDPRTA